MTTETTALTVQDRAALALESSTAETYLIELAGKSKAITAITNKDGRTECHAAAMTAKEARINIEKAGKSAREDATAFSKAVISEEARLVALIKPEETRLIELRDVWDAKAKAEKEAAEALERQRVETIKARIADFGAMVTDAAMLEAHGAEQELEVALAVEINESFGEFYGDAVEAKAVTVAKLREIVAAKTAAEATAARIKAEQEAETIRLAEEAKRLAAERAEMDRIAAAQRAEQAEMQRQEDARQAEERARLNAERLAFEAQQAAVRAQQDRVAAELEQQRKELAAAQAKAQREADEKAAAIQADADAKIAAEKAEAERLAAEGIRKLDADRKAAEEKNDPVSEVHHVSGVISDVSLTNEGKTIKLGEICSRLGFTITAEFLASLGYRPIATDKNAKLYAESQWRGICSALVQHISNVAVGMKRLEAKIEATGTHLTSAKSAIAAPGAFA